jgi:hypothetical protein
LAVTARADQGAERGGADVDDRGGLYAGENARGGDGQLDEAEASETRQPEGLGGIADLGGDARESGSRVPDDGEQAVEEEGGDGGARADPQERDHEYEQRERRDRLHESDEAEQHLARARPSGGEDSEWHCDDERGRQRNRDELQVLDRPCRDPRRAPLAARSGADAERPPQEFRRDARLGLVAELDARIHLDHLARRDSPLEPPQSCDRCLGKILAPEEHGVVLGEEMTNVL